MNIRIDLGLGDLADVSLDLLARLCDLHHAEAPTAWGRLHAATLDERVRRVRLLRSRSGNPGGTPLAGLKPILLIIPRDLEPRLIQDAFNSVRRAYLALEPTMREPTTDGCLMRAIAPVLVATLRGFYAAANAAADRIAGKRLAAAMRAPLN